MQSATVHRLIAFFFFFVYSVNRIDQRFVHRQKNGLNIELSNKILTLLYFLSSYRTKSQKKRFEEELNERMIQAIDGINAQK